MGCWNGTCMVTRLPILYGEKVKLTFLYNKQAQFMRKYDDVSVLNKSGIVYASDMLTPAFYPITGEYDDYGSIQNIEEDFNFQIIEKTLKAIFGSKIKVDDEEVVDWNLYDIIKGIEREDCFYWSEKENEWKPFDLSYTFIRADIYDFLAEKMLTQKILSWKHRDYVSVEKVLKTDFEEELAYLKEKKELLDKDDNKAVLRLEMGMRSDDRIFKRGESGTPFLLHRHLYDDYFYSIFEDKDKTEELYKFWSAYKCLETYMGDARIAWMLQSGSGSQDAAWDLSKMVAEKVISICDKQMEEWEDNWEDEDEE